jgi:quercetin dioxygenase-like cupin family protein
MKIIAQASEEEVVITPEGGERRILSYGGAMMLAQFSFGAGVETAIHSHPHEQIGYVVSGAIDLIMDGRAPVHLTAGASYYVPSGVRHGIVVHEPTVLIDCFMPIREDFLPASGA